MTRLTNSQYLSIHKRLKRIWHHADIVYGHLAAHEQWYLHDYFQPTKYITRDELLAHRKLITKQQPGLAQKAGRALAKFDAAAVHWALTRQHEPAVRKRRNGRTKLEIKLYGVANPELDAGQMAKILIRLARQWQTEQNKAQDKGDQAA